MRRLLILLAGLVIIAGAVGAWLWLRPQPLIPSAIRKSAVSIIFVPSSPAGTAQKGTVKYNSQLKLLSYQASIFGISSVVSEQPTPDTFTDIPAVYQKVLDSWNQYDQFDAVQGTVYLTRPDGPKGKEVGVMNSKGTLMFMKPVKDLTGDQWRQVFNSLQILS